MKRDMRVVEPAQSDHSQLNDEMHKAALSLMVTHGYSYDAAFKQMESSLTETTAALNAELIEDGHILWAEENPWMALRYALGSLWHRLGQKIHDVFIGDAPKRRR